MTMNLKYPMLQSGFVSLREVGLTQKLPQNQTFSETILLIPINHEYDNLFYSEEVSKLFQEAQGNYHLLRKFEFQERIMAQAMACFGPRFVDWLQFQGNKPAFSTTHKQFLTRVISWATPGDTTPHESAEAIKWIGLLGPSQGNNVNFNVSQFPGLSAVERTADALQSWLSKDAGIESLLVHLYVIFGQRVGHIQKPTLN